MGPKSASHGVIFSLLVILVLGSVGLSLLSLPVLVHNLVIFSIALVMAGLVLGQYMGLRIEGPLVLWLVIIPVILFVILTFLMMPDIGHVPVEYLRLHE